MADYTSGNLAMYGTIKTILDLGFLVESIISQGVMGCVTEKYLATELDIYAEIIATLTAEPKSYDALTLRADELAGGEMPLVMSAASKAHLALVATWSGCRYFDAGAYYWHPEHGEDRCVSNEDGVILIPLSALVALRASSRFFTGTAELVEKYQRFEGKGFPPFRVSDEVRAFIAKELAD